MSAHLQSVRSVVAEELPEGARPKDGGRICTGCGSILIPSWSCRTQRDNVQKQSHHLAGKNGRAKRGADFRKVQCSLCNATTSIPPKMPKKPTAAWMPKSEDVAKALKPEPPNATMPPSVPRTDVRKTITAANRKTRSKKSSLQALLATQKRTCSTPNSKAGLDIMDFMRV